MLIFTGSLFLFIATLLQNTIVSRITLLQGPADLVLLVLVAWMLQEHIPMDWRWGAVAGLMLGLSSGLPFWVLLLAYVLAAALCQFLQTRVWQVTLLTLFTSVIAGTLIVQGLSLVYLWLNASPMNFLDALN